jgi:UDP-N-acetylglucosamine 2-epimerase (non-hydrolysing)
LTANKLGLRLGHIEAGLRSHDRGMPEEINRILVDHAADDLFAPTSTAVGNLLREGIPSSRVVLSGNTVVDELLLQRGSARERNTAGRLGLERDTYALATVHRAENVDDADRLAGILSGIAQTARTLAMPILLSLHPRTTARIEELGLALDPAIQRLPPLGYLEFLSLHEAAALLLTDSGGLQEEACALGVPCVTMRDTTERPESIDVGASVLAGANADAIVGAAMLMVKTDRSWRNPFGDGHSGQRIIDSLVARKVHEPPVAIAIGESPDSGDAAALAMDAFRSRTSPQ